MSDELYYRGNDSYETAVKNRLNELERSGVRNTAAMLSGIQNMEYGIRGEIRESTCAIIASQSILAESFKDSFDSVNNTLNIGFEMVAAGMGQLADSINAMSEAICNKLDEIHDIVNNPLLTASRELFRRASANFEKGYFEEALEDCKAAVEKNKTDYISWYLLGQIYLFGAGKFSNVIDLHKAEDAFLNAAKYIDADLGKSKEADELGSQIYYHLGYTRLLLSNDLLVEEKTDESNKKLEEAQKASKNSSYLNNRNVKALYDNAKELHFLGKDKEAIEELKAAVRLEKNFALIAANDKNFESIWLDIEKAVLELRDELVQKCREKLRNIKTKSAESIAESRSEYEKKIESVKDKDLFAVSAFFEKELEPYCLDAKRLDSCLEFARFLKKFFEEAEDYLGLVSGFFSRYADSNSFITIFSGGKIYDCLSSYSQIGSIKIVNVKKFDNEIDGVVFGDLEVTFNENSPSHKILHLEEKTLSEITGDVTAGIDFDKLFVIKDYSLIIQEHKGLFSKIEYYDENVLEGDLAEAGSKTFPEISEYLCKFNRNLKNKEITEILKDIDEIRVRDSDRLQVYKKICEEDDNAKVKNVNRWGTLKVGEAIEDEYSGEYYSCNYLIDGAEISDGVKKLKKNAFLCCKSLKSVKLPDSLEVIGNGAFLGCGNLKTINIPDSVKEIQKSAFAGCKNLDEKTKAKIASINPKALEYGGGCYVATCVYGSYDCSQVWTLRRFRDNTLGSTWYGRLFIKTYYAVSPTLVKWFGKTSWFKNMWKPVLDKMVSRLQSEGVESTPYEDKMWR